MIRAPVLGLTPGERHLHGDVARYLARVLRLQVGDSFVAFDPESGAEADAVMLSAEHGAVTVQLGAPRDAAPARRPLTWIQGFAKKERCDAVVRDATELGATHVMVAITKRTIVRLDAGHASERSSRWSRVAREAARQCGRNDPPRVDPPRPWAEALTLVTNDVARFCLWEKATQPLGPPLLRTLASPAALAFACGPEGGLEDNEVEFARSLGWTIVSLGSLILRTETVAAAVLGAVGVWAMAFESRGMQPPGDAP